MEATHRCGSCGAPVLLARLPDGEWLPLDPDADRRGQVILLDGRRCFPVDPRFAHGEEVQVRRHWNHRTTCRLRRGPQPPPRSGPSVATHSPAAALRLERLRAVRQELRGRPGR